IRDQPHLAASKLPVRSGHVKRPVKLLAYHVNKNRVLTSRKFVHAVRPKRNRESNQQDGFDQNAGKLQMRRDRAAHAVVIGFWMAAFAKAKQNKNEKD